MRYAVASDIHGSSYWCARLLDSIAVEEIDRIILLGDLMYHGPRNPLPEGYDPAEVARMLNPFAPTITAVRGNCDSEVDQMLLDFPCMADYALIVDGTTQLFCTHGHLNLDETIEKLPVGSIILSGHTHVKVDQGLNSTVGWLGKEGSRQHANHETAQAVVQKEDCPEGGIYRLNPGSVSIPKDGSHSYLIYDSEAGGSVEFKILSESH